MGAIFASRVFAVTDLAPGTDASEAPPWAIVEGIEAAFTAGAILIAVGVLLAVYALVIDRRRRAQAVEIASGAG
jgi:hypothetical protein